MINHLDKNDQNNTFYPLFIKKYELSNSLSKNER